MNSTKTKLKLLPLGKMIIPVNVTEEFLNKVKYLCKLIPREEWSGVLFYETKGSIKDPENFEVMLKDVYPMNKGTGAYTEYEFNEELVEYRMDNPETLSMNVGHIHSHNSMQTFFSGTDEDELADNAPHHNYYLSVIVNNYLDFSVRIGMYSYAKKFNSKDEEGNDYSFDTDGIALVFYYNGKVVLKEEVVPVPDYFSKSVKNIIVAKDKRDAEFKKKQNQSFSKALINKALPANWGNIDFDSQLPISEIGIDEYDSMMHGFIIELLGQNTPIILKDDDLEVSMVRIANGISGNEISDFVASFTTDYLEAYSNNFGTITDAMEATFLEDLDYVIDTIDEINEKMKTRIFNDLVESLRTFVAEFSRVK